MSTFVLLLITGLALGGLYFLVAAGFSLVFGLMDVLNFAHGAVVTAAAYAGYFAVAHNPNQADTTGRLLLSIGIGVVAGALVSLALEVLLIRPLYERGHLAQLLVTVGLSFAIVALIEGIWGPDPHSYRPPGWLTDSVRVAGAGITIDRILLIALALAVLAGLLLLLARTRLGLIIRAGVENRAMVSALGINVANVFTVVFVLAGALAGLAGVLAVVFFRQVMPTMGSSFLLFAVIVIIVGGLGSITGSALAAAAVALIQQFANYQTAGLGDILVVLLLAGVLLVRPSGLMGRSAT